MKEKGYPNFYDVQRFGKDNKNVELGFKILKGEKLKTSPYRRRLYVSAVSSWVFNLYLKRRMDLNLHDEILDGDLLVDREDNWVLARFADEDELLVPTGPILGYKMPIPEGRSWELERDVIEEVGVSLEDFKKFKAKGSRRAIRVYPKNMNWQWEGNSLVLRFFLPKGSYATTMLKWVQKEDASTFC